MKITTRINTKIKANSQQSYGTLIDFLDRKGIDYKPSEHDWSIGTELDDEELNLIRKINPDYKITEDKR